MIENFKDMDLSIYPETKFVGYEQLNSVAKIVGLFNENQQVIKSLAGHGYVLVDQTPFFAMGGGQASDHGLIEKNGVVFELIDVRKDIVDGYYLHEVNVIDQVLNLGDELSLEVDQTWRHNSSISHSSIHMIWKTILNHVGHSVGEIGSKLDGEKYQLQYVVDELMTADLVASAIDEFNNQIIKRNISPEIYYISQQEAIEKDYLFEFTKLKPGEMVRIVDFPGVVLEACSGTHVNNTSEITRAWFLHYDQNSKRTLIDVTSNPDYAKTYFTEKLNGRFNELQDIINKAKNQGVELDLSSEVEQAKNLLNTWNYFAIKKMNELCDEVGLIVNKAIKVREKELINQIKDLELEYEMLDQFCLIKTNNDLYVNKLMLPKISQFSQQHDDKTTIFINEQSQGSNVILVHDRKLDYNLKELLLPKILENTNLKGGGSDSMLQLTSTDINDVNKLLELLK